ncbi:MAG: DUF3696 domain-containing protein [Anaerolineaceae bacterium]|nr:DUF3696 domain-containing protein [Anaerolineaceae bacterium]
MITNWKVFNFKSIREETELTFAPLTIFAGANSSGKSTFIQSILLVAQTLSNKVSSRSVVLNGALTSLGQFDDLKSSGSESDQIAIKCTCRPLPDTDKSIQYRSVVNSFGAMYYGLKSNQFREITCKIYFDADTSSSQRDMFQIQPRLFASQLSCILRGEDQLDQYAELSVRNSSKLVSEIDGIKNLDEIDDQLRESLAYDVDIDEISMAEVREDWRSAKAIGCDLRHFLPEQIVYSIDNIQEDAHLLVLALQDDALRSIRLQRSRGREFLLSKEVIDVLREVLHGAIDFDMVVKPEDFQVSLFEENADVITFKDLRERLRSLPSQERIKTQQILRECDDLFDRIHKAMTVSSILKSEPHAIIKTRPPRQIIEAAWYLDRFFTSSLKYLGPLRDAPKPLYPLAPAADPYDVGLRGEHTASILDLHKNRKIKYIPPTNFMNAVIDRRTTPRTLETAVTDWLQYLGVASSVQSRDMGKLGHELKVALSDSGINYDLTHVGVGVSQVLPILVICLLAETDSTLVFEQPELHLHPKVQTLLGDFFLSMALCNKQCIVETHSEYFIDRLRYRIAASPENDLNSKTKIYFVEKPSKESSFREVVINEYGAISEWPDGFFDQSQQQAEGILNAALAKKRAKRSGEKSNG